MEVPSAGKPQDVGEKGDTNHNTMHEIATEGKESEERLLDLSFLYRSKVLKLRLTGHSTLLDLGQQLVSASGIVPHTLRLLLPRVPALLPFSPSHSSLSILQSGITEDRVVRMMGALPGEIDEVSREAGKGIERTIIGFSEEEERAKKWRTGKNGQRQGLPQGNYIFCDFRTLQLPGIELNPSAAKALEIMHKLASDPGIVAIMNKHRWRIGVMTEMAPVGYVGISPKCLLGYNKNQGEEISLRLRTDDLKGFRKYEIIKKTLLHELAHMVHSEHDAHFYALDKQLNEEAMSLDWTKSGGQSVGGFKSAYDDDDAVELTDAGGVFSSGGRKLGGSSTQQGARSAAALAALSRLSGNKETIQNENGSAMDITVISEGNQSDIGMVSGQEPDLDRKDSEGKSNQDISQIMDIDKPLEHSVASLMENKQDIGPISQPVMSNEVGDSENSHLNHSSGCDCRVCKEMKLGPVDWRSNNLSGSDFTDKVGGNNPLVIAGTSQIDRETENEGTEANEAFQRGVESSLMEDSSLKLLQESSEDVCKKVNNAILKLRAEAPPAEAAAAIQSLYKILRNLMEHPYEEKFKRLRKANAAFRNRIARFEGAIEVLKAVGFSEEPGADSDSECLILMRNDPVLLWLAQSSLEACMA